MIAAKLLAHAASRDIMLHPVAPAARATIPHLRPVPVARPTAHKETAS
jgi:hypothetical protein